MMRKYKLPTGEIFHTSRRVSIECVRFIVYSSRCLRNADRKRRAAYSQLLGQKDAGCVIKITYHIRGLLWRTTYFYSPTALNAVEFEQLCRVID